LDGAVDGALASDAREQVRYNAAALADLYDAEHALRGDLRRRDPNRRTQMLTKVPQYRDVQSRRNRRRRSSIHDVASRRRHY